MAADDMDNMAMPHEREPGMDMDDRELRELMRSRLYTFILWGTCILFWIVFVINFIIICIALYYMKKKTGCGIPLYEWIIIEAILCIIKYFGLLFAACFVYRNLRRLPLFLIVWLFTLGWI